MSKIIHCLVAVCLLQVGLAAQNSFSVKERNPVGEQIAPKVDRVINGQAQSIINSTQGSSFQTLPSINLNRTKHLKTTRSPITGMPILIKGFQTSNKSSLNTAEGVREASFGFLESIQEDICLENAREEFDLTSQRFDDKGDIHHIRFQQEYQGIPIYGADIAVHVKKSGEMSFNGRSQPSPVDLDLTPVYNYEQVKEVAIGDISTRTNFVEMNDECKNMLHYHEPIKELVIYPSDENFGHFKLVWHLTVRPNFLERYEYFVNAHTGEIVNFFNNTCSLVADQTTNALDANGVMQTIHTYDYQGNYYLYDASRPMYSGPVNGLPQAGDGGIETLNFQGNAPNNPSFADFATPDNNFNQSQYQVAVSAHHNAGECYEYFRNTFGRESINGQGGDIISFINVGEQGGGDMDNAFWNGQYMFYGNGATAFQPLAKALDVAGHEMSHGVIQSTANLIYQGQSGAINEHIADVFGAMIDRDDWGIGEDVTNTSYIASGMLRDMQNPNNGPGNSASTPGWQPANMDEIFTLPADNGGVHFNSGIPNRAYYLMATDIGKDKAEQIYYLALTDYLTRNSQFIDLRIAVLEAADVISDVNANDIADIANAFAAVGIGDGAATQTQEDLELNPGDEYILSLDTNPDQSNTLYVSPSNGQGFEPLTQVPVNRKPSITDDGSDIYFVGEDHQVYHIDMTAANPQEAMITNDAVGIWENVAVSKDGARLALISTSIDSSIYVYDIASQTTNQYELYNPTFTEGVEAGGVRYADSFEWDYSGEFILYDALNLIQGSGVFAENVEYWDMGVLKAWDNDANFGNGDFGDGNIQKIFSNLPTGVSVGNPAFSKNSPYIFAFDYLEGNTTQLRGINVETGDVGIIRADSDVLNFASYSGDDSSIAFDDLDGTTDVVSVVDLADNKIQAQGSETILLGEDAKWPVWFVDGERVLAGIEDLPVQIESLTASPNPFAQRLEIQIDLVANTRFSVNIMNLNGQLVGNVPEQFYGIGTHNIRIPNNNLAAGAYLIQLQGKNMNKTIKVVKQ